MTGLYRETDNEAFLREAIEVLEVAVQSVEDGHAEKVKYLFRLGSALTLLYGRSSDTADRLRSTARIPNADRISTDLTCRR